VTALLLPWRPRRPACGATPARAVLLLLLAVLLLAVVAPRALAQDVLPVPALEGRVIDQTGTLGAARAPLEAKLADVEHATGSQIVILMVATTQPEDIASYAYRVADAWKIGRRDVGDGILVVVAKDDRHMRIEVAKALEGAVPDLAAYQIIDRTLRPAFKAGDYAGGLSAAVDQLAARIRGENLPPPDARQGQGAGPAADGHGRNHRGDGQFNVVAVLFAIFVAASILKSLFGRTLGSLATGAGTGAIAWLSGSGLALAGVAGVVALVMSALLGRSGMSGIGPGLGRGRGGLWAAGLGGALGGGLGGLGGRGGFGGGGFGGGGGGFSSGGGGDFGGGGASGNW
jgi:uncharacterized protein